MKQVLGAINYCHDKKIAHRDLKPENVLLATPKELDLRLIDFGTSQLFEQGKTMSQTFGTPYYIAPEVLKGKYTEKCDIWSLGVILYILLCGKPPFNARTDEEIYNKVRIGKFAYSDPSWKSRSDHVKDLINKMLTYDPEKRISASDCLQHPWIVKEAASKIDPGVAQHALSNLKQFQVSFLRFIGVEYSKDAAGSSHFHCQSIVE